MKKFIGMLISTFLNIENIRFTEEAIKDILKSQPRVPVTINFNKESIGIADKFFEKGGNLLCEFNVDDNKAQAIIELMDKAYVVPGLDNVKYHYDGRTRVIDAGDLTEVSVSLLPIDIHLNPIKLKGEGK